MTIKTTSKYSIISLENWHKYQSGDQQNDQQAVTQATSKRPASDQQVTTNKNDKNDKNEENEKNIPPVSPKGERKKFIPPTYQEAMSCIREYCLDKKLIMEPIQVGLLAEDFIEHYENTGWKLSSGKGATMKDWKLSLKKWIRTEFKSGKIARAV